MGDLYRKSWLTDKRPPYGYTKSIGEHRLWWAVIRQAAHDLRYSHRSNATDALEFLKDTGLWLSESMFAVPEDEYKREVARIVIQRNAALSSTQAIRPG